MKRIAVMTSGGDSPGMNAAVRAVVRTGTANGLEVYGIRHAYEGLIKGDFERLGPRDVSGILGTGGTVLHTARCPEFRESKGQNKGLTELQLAQIDGLVVIGGDGSLNGALALHGLDFPVVGLPGSIDNDIWGTNMSIGVDTALNTILNALDSLRDTASAHRRAFLVETMGRSCGYLALMGGILGGAELIMIPEVDTKLDEVAQTIEDAYATGKNHAIVVIAEGAKFKTTQVAKYLKDQADYFEVRITILGHLQRGGRPTAFDRLLATRMGVRAVEALMEGEHGIMIGLHGREMGSIALEEVCGQSRQANLAYYDMAKILS
jgi:6-phosphofructokinase 1